MLRSIWNRITGKATASNYTLDAARYDDAWPYSPWPLWPNMDIDGWDLRTVWQRARALYENSPQIRKAVKNMVQFTGGLQPLPMTTDAEWNKQALAAFRARTKNPATFDVAGKVNYKQALCFMERCAIIDGDVAMVLSVDSNLGAVFAFYKAPQVTGGGKEGVEVDAQGRAVAYYVTATPEGEAKRLPASAVVLYQHDPDPTRLRGHSELVAALRNANDVHNIVGYAKNGQRISNSMGLVSTKAVGARVSDLGRQISGSGGKKNACTVHGGEQAPKTELGTGLNITYLPEGCDIRAISDGRPSTQLQEFFKFLTRCIAQGVGLDPEVLFYSNEMGSAAVRFSLEKVRAWQEERLVDLEVVCNVIWRHVIACEMASGRLRKCKDKAWQNVRWVPRRDMTIDTPRVANAQIQLKREGMADTRDFCLRTTGMTPEQLAEQDAAEIAYAKEMAAKYGLSYAELRPGAVGSVPVEPEEPAAEPLPVPVDDDPEAV